MGLHRIMVVVHSMALIVTMKHGRTAPHQWKAHPRLEPTMECGGKRQCHTALDECFVPGIHSNSPDKFRT